MAHTVKLLLRRNDSAVFCWNTNTYTKISLPHYAEITLISAGKIKSHWSMMKAAGPSQLLCRMPHAALPLCSARLLLKSDQKKRVLKTRRGGGSFLAWNQTFAAKFQPRSNFLQLSYKTLGRKRLGNREGSKTEGFLMERQAWPSLQQSKWVMLESSRGERSCFKAKRWNTIWQQ